MVDVDDGGQHVGQRFAGARLRDADHVLSGERDRPALRLDRRWALESVGSARREQRDRPVRRVWCGTFPTGLDMNHGNTVY